jgi:hypothetical protein
MTTLRTFPEPDRVEAAALLVLLDLHPAPITTGELYTRLGVPDGAPLGDRDEIDVAISELAGYGLLHQHDGWLLATQPAIHAARLLG